MLPTLLNIQELADRLFPFNYSESWDNSGIQIGDFSKTITAITFSLNASVEAISFAAENQCELLITHHPVLLNPVKKILASEPTGKVFLEAAKANVDVMSLHTNFDAAKGGLNDFLSGALSLSDVQIPVNAPCARLGMLPEPQKVSALAKLLCQKLNLDSVRIVGSPQQIVKSIFLVSGSGMGYLDEAILASADIMITGDIRYHGAIDSQFYQIPLIDAGHFGLEKFAIKLMRDTFETEFSKLNWNIKLHMFKGEEDPFKIYAVKDEEES
ncbi:MAG: Nif3-like dinuclear metal center hexameric protein [Desulfomonilaceae bacterium]